MQDRQNYSNSNTCGTASTSMPVSANPQLNDLAEELISQVITLLNLSENVREKLFGPLENRKEEVKELQANNLESRLQKALEYVRQTNSFLSEIQERL